MERTRERTGEARRLEPPLSWMARIWALWFLLYFGGGLLAESQGETGFLASTVDHVESLWVKAVFLNLPLQLVLVAVALLCAGQESRTAQRVGVGAGGLATFLIAAHATISAGIALWSAIALL